MYSARLYDAVRIVKVDAAAVYCGVVPDGAVCYGRRAVHEHGPAVSRSGVILESAACQGRRVEAVAQGAAVHPRGVILEQALLDRHDAVIAQGAAVFSCAVAGKERTGKAKAAVGKHVDRAAVRLGGIAAEDALRDDRVRPGTVEQGAAVFDGAVLREIAERDRRACAVIIDAAAGIRRAVSGENAIGQGGTAPDV